MDRSDLFVSSDYFCFVFFDGLKELTMGIGGSLWLLRFFSTVGPFREVSKSSFRRDDAVMLFISMKVKGFTGEWSTMRSPNGRLAVLQSCQRERVNLIGSQS